MQAHLPINLYPSFIYLSDNDPEKTPEKNALDKLQTALAFRITCTALLALPVDFLYSKAVSEMRAKAIFLDGMGGNLGKQVTKFERWVENNPYIVHECLSISNRNPSLAVKKSFWGGNVDILKKALSKLQDFPFALKRLTLMDVYGSVVLTSRTEGCIGNFNPHSEYWTFQMRSFLAKEFTQNTCLKGLHGVCFGGTHTLGVWDHGNNKQIVGISNEILFNKMPQKYQEKDWLLGECYPSILKIFPDKNSFIVLVDRKEGEDTVIAVKQMKIVDDAIEVIELKDGIYTSPKPEGNFYHEGKLFIAMPSRDFLYKFFIDVYDLESKTSKTLWTFPLNIIKPFQWFNIGSSKIFFVYSYGSIIALQHVHVIAFDYS